MSPTPLVRACLDGKVAVVKKLVADGARLDGGDGELFNDEVEGCVKGAPYHLPLGDAARMGYPAVVKVLLEAGAAVDEINYRGETALILAAREGELASVKLLLEAGANATVVGCTGSALAAVQMGWRPHAIAVGKLLLAAGCSPAARASYTTSAIEQWARRIPEGGKIDPKIGKPTLEMLQLARPHAGDHAALADAAIARLEAKVGAAKKAAAKTAATSSKLATATGADWAARIEKMLRGPLDKDKARAEVEGVCKDVLTSSAAIAHKAWPALVKTALELSWTYGDITEASYGKRLPLSQLENDEGGAMDAYADNHLYTFDWILELLAKPEAIAHAKWPDLVRAVCEQKQKAVGYYSFGDEEIAALLAVKAAKAHARYGELVGVARAAFPYASCFGANGFLRDFKGSPKAPTAKATPSAKTKAKKTAAKPTLKGRRPNTSGRSPASSSKKPGRSSTRKAPTRARPRAR